MLITGLRAKNWACHSSLDMKFKAGLNGVLGVNGSGKSSILDALRFGATNKTIAAGQRGDNLKTGQKSGFVEVDITHGEAAYTIRRSIETSKCKMTCGEQTWVKAADIDDHLESLLQTKIDALLNNVFVGQHAIDDILFKTNTERLKEFQDTFGLTRMSEAYRVLSMEIASCSVTPGLTAQRDLLVAASKESRDALVAAQGELRQMEQRIADLMGVSERVVMHESLVQLRESRERSLTVLDTLEKEAVAVEQQLAATQRQIEEIRLVNAQHAEEVIAAVTLIATHKTSGVQRQTLIDELKRLEAVLPPVQSVDDLQASLDKASERQQKLAAIASGQLPLPQLPGDAELIVERDEIVGKIKEDVGLDIRMLESDLARELGIAKTFASGSCPTCLRPMEDFNPAAQQKKVDDVRAALQAAKTAHSQRISLLKQRQATVEEELRKHQLAAMTSVTKALSDAKAASLTLTQQVSLVRKAVATYAAAQARKVEAEAALRTIPVVLNEAAAMAEETVRANTDRASKLTTLQTQTSILTAKLASNVQEKERVCAAMPTVDGTGLMTPEEYAQAKALELQLNKLFADKRDIETRVGIAQAKLGNQEATVTQLNEQIEKESKVAAWSKLCGRARDVIHVSGLPTLMMKEYAARINKRVAHYLQIWEAPFRLFLDDSLSFRARFDTGYELPAARLSGGQKIVASTSFRLAMSDTFAKNVGLLILDEPTNHLDKENVVHLQQLLVKLKQMSGASQRQIIIVTHEEQLTGFFDHTIQLAKIG